MNHSPYHNISCKRPQNKNVKLYIKHDVCFIGSAYESEHERVVQRYENDISLLKQRIEDLQNKTEEEREVIAQRFEEEKEAMEDEIARAIRQELEVGLSYILMGLLF